jgi:hypothetical protein
MFALKASLKMIQQIRFSSFSSRKPVFRVTSVFDDGIKVVHPDDAA